LDSLSGWFAAIHRTAFSELLARMAALPANLIIDKTPLTDLPEFVTLQDLGPRVCPYRIFNRARFLQSIELLGYRLVDSWISIDFSSRIPFHPDKHVPSDSGLYFRAISISENPPPREQESGLSGLSQKFT
jgi:putative methyltransferase (TIGR04325 family)